MNQKRQGPDLSTRPLRCQRIGIYFTSLTIEHGEGEEEGEPLTSILRAFGSLGWHGVDDNGEYVLFVILLPIRSTKLSPQP